MTYAIRFNRMMRLLGNLLGMGPSRSGVRIDGDDVEIWMGWAFRMRVPRAHITGAERLDRLAWWWGQGVHGWRGKVVVNGANQGLVRLRLDPPADARAPMRASIHEVVVSLEDPDGFLAALG